MGKETNSYHVLRTNIIPMKQAIQKFYAQS